MPVIGKYLTELRYTACFWYLLTSLIKYRIFSNNLRTFFFFLEKCWPEIGERGLLAHTNIGDMAVFHYMMIYQLT